MDMGKHNDRHLKCPINEMCMVYFLIENNYISSYSRHFGERQVLIEFN